MCSWYLMFIYSSSCSVESRSMLWKDGQKYLSESVQINMRAHGHGTNSEEAAAWALAHQHQSCTFFVLEKYKLHLYSFVVYAQYGAVCSERDLSRLCSFCRGNNFDTIAAFPISPSFRPESYREEPIQTLRVK